MQHKIIKVVPLNLFYIKIHKAIAYMPVDMYTQWASKGPKDRLYVSRGVAGGLSISEKNVTILAQRIAYMNSKQELL